VMPERRMVWASLSVFPAMFPSVIHLASYKGFSPVFLLYQTSLEWCSAMKPLVICGATENLCGAIESGLILRYAVAKRFIASSLFHDSFESADM